MRIVHSTLRDATTPYTGRYAKYNHNHLKNKNIDTRILIMHYDIEMSILK
jgi:hypothetical protein